MFIFLSFSDGSGAAILCSEKFVVKHNLQVGIKHKLNVISNCAAVHFLVSVLLTSLS
jgi:hypothetical protein